MVGSFRLAIIILLSAICCLYNNGEVKAGASTTSICDYNGIKNYKECEEFRKNLSKDYKDTINIESNKPIDLNTTEKFDSGKIELEGLEPADITPIDNSFWGRFKDRVGGVIENIGTYLSKMSDGVKNGYSNVTSKLSGAFNWLGNASKQIYPKLEYGYLRIKDYVSPYKVADYKDLENIKNEEFRRYKKIEHINKKYEVNVQDGDKKWSEEELGWVKEVLDDVPKKFYGSSELNKLDIIRNSESKSHASICATNFGGNLIEIYDLSSNCISYDPQKYAMSNIIKYRKVSFKHSFVHELSHSYDKPENFAIVDKFISLSWKSKLIKIKLGRKYEYVLFDRYGRRAFVKKDKGEKFVSEYAGNLNSLFDGFETLDLVGLPGEDLAESVAFYVYQPAELKIISIRKYNYIKEYIFGGKEFNEN